LRNSTMMSAAHHLRPAGSADMRDDCGACGQGDRLLNGQTRPHSREVTARSRFLDDWQRSHGLRLLLPGRGPGSPRPRRLNLDYRFGAVGAERIRPGRHPHSRRRSRRPGDVCHPRRRRSRTPPNARRRHSVESADLLTEQRGAIPKQREYEHQANSPVVFHGSTQPVFGSPRHLWPGHLASGPCLILYHYR
jgi:hypothetical protein